MISLQEFIDKWTGIGIDFDGSYGNQCFDLYRQYCKEVLGVPQSSPTGDKGAVTIWDTYLTQYFDRIPNTPTGVPQPGDIMIWGKAYGKFGHVAVVTEATVNTFKCFSQNDPTGSLPAIRWYKTYTPTLGWLRAKEVTTSDNIETLKKDLAESNKTKDNLQNQVNGLLVDIKAWETKYNECNAQRIEAGSSSDGFRSQLNTLVAQLATKLGTRQEVPEILASVDTCLTFEDANVELQKKLAKEESDHAQAVDALEAKIKALESNLVTLKADFKALKDTQIAPTQPVIKYSIIDIIKKYLGVKYV